MTPKSAEAKIPLFSSKDILPLLSKVGFNVEAPDLWTISKINVSADLQYLTVALSHLHQEVGPLFLLKRSPCEGALGVSLSGGSMAILHFAEKVFNFIFDHDARRGVTVLYTIPNAQLRPYRVMLVSGEGERVREVYTEGNSANFVDVGLTRGKVRRVFN